MNNNKRKRIVYLVVLLILIISIGYAVLSTVFNLNSTISLKKVSFDIHLDNVNILNSSAVVTEDAHITNEAKTEISFNISLNDLDDNYKFTTDIVNEGKIPGKIRSINLTGITDSQKKLIKYRAYYTDSKKDVSIGDFVGPNSTKNMTVEVIYELADDITSEDMLTDDTTLECVFTITVDNADISDYKSGLIPNVISKDVDFYPTNLINFEALTTSSEHQGLYAIESTLDNEHPIYFYRGIINNVNNHIKFSGFCWRIIRTTDTGGTKIIYNGVPNEDGKCLNTNSSDVSLDNTRKYSDISYEWNSSTIKQELNTWFFENINVNQSYLEDTHFCNSNQYSNGDISLECDAEDEVSVENGKNDYPIGLITAQEANLCGSTSVNSASSGRPWLDISSSYWTMTGDQSMHEKGIWVIQNESRLYTYTGYNYCFTHWSHFVRPVVSLNNIVRIEDGDGTANNPYTVTLG